MNRRTFAALTLCIAVAAISGSSHAQTNPNLEIGLKPYGAYDSSDFDSVDVANGNVFVHIPLISYPQRGSLTEKLYMVANGKNFYVSQVCNNQLGTCTSSWRWGNDPYQPGPPQGPGAGVSIVDRNFKWVHWRTVSPNNWATVYTWDGGTHQMAQLTDGSGDLEPFDGSVLRYKNSNGLIIDSSGNSFGLGSGATDPNGNYFSIVTGPPSAEYDTMGRNLWTLVGGASTTDYTGCAGALPTTSASILSGPGLNGGTLQIKLCYANGALKTNFHAYDYDPYANKDLIQEVQGTAQFLQTVIVYDGNSWATSPKWTFAFDAGVPGDTNVHYGDLLSVTLPTGGTISYAWSTKTFCGTRPALIPVSRIVTSRTVNANDGLGNLTTTYGSGGIVTDPAGNDTVHVITALGNTCSLYETEVDSYQGSHSAGTLLKKVLTNYQYQTNPFDHIGDGTTSTATNVYPTQITTIWPATNQQSQVQMTYDANLAATAPAVVGTAGYTMSYGNLTEEREYDYGSGGSGPLLRRKDYTYLAFNNSSYKTANMLERVASETVYNGTDAQVAQTTYSYDEYGLQTTSTPQHGAPPFSVRGNRTSVKRWLNTTGGTLNTTTTYFDTGMPYQVTDPKGNVTTYTYSGTYDGAYVTQTTMPATGSVQHIVSAAYDFNTGKISSFTDQNGQVSSYQYDTLWRPTSASYPDGGQLTLLYPDLQTIEVQKKIDSRVKDSFSYVDGLARTKQTKLQSDPQGPVYADTTYDTDGRVATVSNPYRSTGDSTYGITMTAYDSLNRPTSVTKPDGSIVRTAYCGSTTLVTDEANRWRRSTSDALGRLAEVDEPNSITAAVNSNGCPGTGEPIWVTTYGYDALDDLTSVVQGGSRNRSFVYDSLKRLTTSTNPETGTVTYTYDADGNVATKRDARSITSTYSYDALSRTTGVTYSNGDPSLAYTYDQSTCVGQSPCYNIGRRTTMTDTGGTENLSYDKMGREWGEQRTTNLVTKITTYAYDVAGDLTTLTYPSGRTITYTYDSAQRPSLAQDVANNVTYAQGNCSNGIGSNGACYAPHGALAQVKNGTNLTSTTIYNNRLQPCWFYATTGSALATNSTCTGTAGTGNILDLKYGFNLGGSDNGNVVGVTNNRDANRTESFTYDQVNRIITGQTNATTGANCWGEVFTYDQWANLTTIGGVSGYGNCTQDNLGVSATTGNQLSFAGFSYDSSGDMLTDGLTTYGWNAESQIKSAAGVNYTYDGDGNRLQKSTGTIYWYGAGTDILAESDLSGNFTNEYIYFGGKRIARIAAH